MKLYSIEVEPSITLLFLKENLPPSSINYIQKHERFEEPSLNEWYNVFTNISLVKFVLDSIDFNFIDKKKWSPEVFIVGSWKTMDVLDQTHRYNTRMNIHGFLTPREDYAVLLQGFVNEREE